MLIIENTTKYEFDKKLFFFDIETTGLSAQTSYIYEIGILYFNGRDFVLKQLFCEDYSEEKALLQEFIKLLSKDDYKLVHYNGSTFDIPYLNHKFKRHKLSCEIDKDTTLDIFKKLMHYKKCFSLPDMKLKSIEQSAGYVRADKFDGGELIDVYAEYTGRRRLYSITKSDEAAKAYKALEYVLLQHNDEDLRGLFEVYDKCNFLNPKTILNKVSFENTEDYLNFHISAPLFPVVFRSAYEGVILESNPTNSVISIPKVNDRLKFYFSNYKDYFTILDSGKVTHISLWNAVEKENRKKCKREDAFLVKSGEFIAVPKALADDDSWKQVEVFKTDIKDKALYIDIKDCMKKLDSYFELLVKELF